MRITTFSSPISTMRSSAAEAEPRTSGADSTCQCCACPQASAAKKHNGFGFVHRPQHDAVDRYRLNHLLRQRDRRIKRPGGALREISHFITTKPPQLHGRQCSDIPGGGRHAEANIALQTVDKQIRANEGETIARAGISAGVIRRTAPSLSGTRLLRSA
ncbi:hypothetical protein IRM71_07695 [Erwinia amylovora]|nr:hypothetical protein IRM68_10165 [Erwinia amylovora]UDK00094.1 hypothetical protein IRM69_06130 [Erwinia amylovora]UDK91019.1 hypothetical protein IRM70_07705 [Erwinia amylovora]UDK94414.1 hypothetical protein IRM71_07695 [Erwinia amylovora]UOD75254.1 hypothetical protein IRM67_02820 [Erwinia amylovora]